MGPKALDEVKAHLKEAKNAIKKKDSQSALRHVRAVLRGDPKNYSALVLEGCALDYEDKFAQSLASYKKATEVSPGSLVAWQGMARLYENRNITKHEDLVLAHKNISNFYEANKEEEKQVESALKLAGALQSQSDFEECLKVLRHLIKSRGNSLQISEMALGALTQMKELDAQQEELFGWCIDLLHENETAKEPDYQRYFRLLYKQAAFEKLEKVCLDLQPRFNSFYHPLDYLCRLYVEDRLSPSSAYIVPTFIDRLFKLYPTSTYGHFAQGKLLLENGKVLDSIAWLRQGMESKVIREAVRLLLSALSRIWDFEAMEDLSVSAMKTKIDEPGLCNEVLLQAYIGQNKLQEARGLLGKVGPKAKAIGTARILAAEEDWEMLKQVLSETEYEDWYFDFLRAGDDIPKLLALAEKEPIEFDLILSIGIKLSKMREYSESVPILSKCLEIFPKHPALLSYVGEFYRLEKQFDTALSYFLNAYEALPSAENGMHLSDLYFELEDDDSNKVLLMRAVKKCRKSKSKWAWLRLGMLHLRLGEADEAVVALQAAVRTDINDPDLWETLGDAYFCRGSLEASLRSFEQCLKLGVEPTYPTLKIGVIYEQLGEGALALETLNKLPDYIPALVEVSKSWLLIAEKKLREGLSIAVINAVEEAIMAAAKVLHSEERTLGLTIIAEAVLLGADLNPDTSLFNLPPIFTASATPGIGELQPFDIPALLMLGINSAMVVLSKSPTKFLAGVQHSLLAKLWIKKGNGRKGLYHGKKAVSLDPSNYTYWNLLGVIAEGVGEESLAQHALIKSIGLNSVGNAVGWTNLGFLTLKHGESLKAHACFTEAQRFQPSYGPCWIGQSLVAEGFDTVEAADIMRHAASLEDTHIFASLRYADWVARTLAAPPKNFDYFNYFTEHLDSLHLSLEKIALFNVREPTACSLNLEGVLKMESGEYGGALSRFERAVKLSTESRELPLLTRNRVTALQKLGNWAGSLELLNTLPPFDVRRKIAAALAFHKLGNKEKACLAYEELVGLWEGAQGEEWRLANAFIANGITRHALGDLVSAKTLLFKGAGISSTPEGHIVLCAQAMTSGDFDFAESIVAEMRRKFVGQESLHHLALLTAFCVIGQGGSTEACRSILSYIHVHPQNGGLWRVLANLLINVGEDGPGARHALHSAHHLGEDLALPGIALTYLMSGDLESGLKRALLAVHGNPCSLPAIAILISALSSLEREAEALSLATRGLRLCSEGILEGATEELLAWLLQYLQLSGVSLD